MLPGRRDSYRIKGFDIFTQRDIDGDWAKRPDQIALAGWKMEDQPSLGFDAKNVEPSIYGGKTMFYNIPLRMLYSKDFSNLLMAGRNMNASHMAFTSTRVINTGAVAGEAAGTAAAICAKEKISPNDIAVNPSRLKALQQLLLKNGNTIVHVKNEDPQDLALSASASATVSDDGTSPQNVLNGYNYDFHGETKNRWMADISKRPSLKIEWDSPQKISRAIVNLDAGSRIVTQSIENAMVKRTLQAPQPEVLKDFDLVAILPDGSEKKLFEIRGNYQKFLKYGFEPLKAKALRLDCLATNGSPLASVFEIRAYA